MTADDVVYSLARLADPRNGSNALSAFKGVLKPEGVVKVDDQTVAFHLDAPNGNFPYLVSSDNYNAIICRAGTDAAAFEKDFEGTGPFKLEKYTAKVGANFVRNLDYWGPKALPARTEFTFFTDQQPQILALQGGQADVLQQVAVQGAQGAHQQPGCQAPQDTGRHTSRSAHALRYGAIYRQARSPGDCVDAGPQGDRRRPVPRPRADG